MPPEDEQLVVRAQRGEVSAFEELVKRHQKRAYVVALGMLRNPADARDVCQEALVKAFKSISRFDLQAQFSTWLHRIVINVCIDQLRRSSKQTSEYDDGVAYAESGDSAVAPVRLGFDPARALGDKELRRRIIAALDQLTSTHRAVLVLREVDGLSYQEIAAHMNCSIGTVMSRLFHARKKMQAALGDLREGLPAA